MDENHELAKNYEVNNTILISRKKVQQMSANDKSADQVFCLVILSGPEAGQLFPLNGTVYTIGRDVSADISLSDLGISRYHASLRSTPEGVYLKDTESANGTFLNGIPVEGERILQDGDKIAIGANTVFGFGSQDEIDRNFYKKLREDSVYDYLTGAHTRKYLFEQLETEIAFAKRQGCPLSLLIYDLDHFKSVNDTYGHPMGDKVLKDVTAVVAEHLRTEDIVCRYGGEEFAVICRKTTLDKAMSIAERIRLAISEMTFHSKGAVFSVTVSIGIAGLGELDSGTTTALISLADQYLYKAKSNGRNCIAGKDKF